MKVINVLVVDDAAFIRDLIKKAMRESYPGFNIQEAADGRKGQSILKSNNIDLVLCDWEMPEMSGLELITWMREQDNYKKTPFMMITSRGERDHVIKAVTAGVNDYIGKPFTRDNFVAKVDKLLAKHYGLSSKAVITAANGKRGNISPAGQSQDDGMAALMGGLSAGSNKKPAAEQGSAAALTANPLVQSAEKKPEKSAQAVKAGTKTKGMAELRFGSGGSVRCIIKDINLQEMSGVFKREGDIPQLLEQVVLDIVDHDAGQVARINCYVRMLQAVESNMDATTIKVVIRYVDDDPKKLDTLSRFIAKVR